MNVGAVLAADLQTPEAVEPGEGAFDHPAVAAQSIPGLDAATGNARDDAPLAQGQAKVPVVVAFVGAQLVWAEKARTGSVCMASSSCLHKKSFQKWSTINDEQIEVLTSSGNPLPQNFFFFTAGIAAALIIQLKSGAVETESKSYLWIAFFVAVILALYFGCFAIIDYIRVRRVKQAIKKQSPTVQAEAPTFRAKAKQ